MAFQKSPGGSIFPYPYKGGELFGLHMGSFGADEQAFIVRMKAEETFLLQQNRSIGLWIDFYETKLSDDMIREFVEFIQHTYQRIPKLGLVGCSSSARRKIDKYLKEAEVPTDFPVRYFNDPERAKTWLVSEGY